MDPLVSVPMWVALVVAAGALAVLPRTLGYALAVALSVLTVPWVLGAPAGTTLVVAPLGFEQTLLRIDSLTRPITAVFGFIATLGLAYAYATDADRQTGAWAAGYMGVSMAAVLAGDWLTLLVAWEAMAVTATVLVWVHGGDAVRPAFRYAVYHLVGGTLLVAAVALHYTATGTFVITGGFTAGLPTVLGVLGVGVNLGFVGLHYWVADTYPRPHVAASVVLAGFTTKVAVYALARLIPDGNLVVAYVGGVTVVYAVWMAILQTDTRRLLSYHIVSQVGYMVAAIGIGTAVGTAGAVAHLSSHVLYKGLLFMVAGAFVYRVGTGSLKELGGLASRMPLTFAAFLVAALAISGVPGFSGFVSKGLVIKSVDKAGLELLWWLLVVGGVGTVLSFAKFGYYAFVRAAPAPLEIRPSRPALSAVLVVAAVPSVVFGLAPGLLFGAVPGDVAGFDPYATSELTKAAAVTTVGLLGFVALRGPLSRLPDPDIDRVLHPAAFRLADGTSRATAGAAGAVAATAGALATSLAERLLAQPTDRPAESAIGTAMLVVAAGLGLTLLLALIG